MAVSEVESKAALKSERDRVPPWVLKALDGVGLTQKATKKSLEAFVARYATPDRTLDIGANRAPYRRFFPNRVGLDVRPMPGVDVVGDAHDLYFFDDDSFDCVLCTEVLEHLHTPSRAIAEIHRVLKGGGTLILTTRFVFPIHSVRDYYRFTRAGLEYLLRDFDLVEIKSEADTIETLAILCQRIGLQCETLYLRPFRLFWLLIAKIIPMFSCVLTKECSEVANKNRIDSIMSSGFYVACRKPLESRRDLSAGEHETL